MPQMKLCHVRNYWHLLGCTSKVAICGNRMAGVSSMVADLAIYSNARIFLNKADRATSLLASIGWKSIISGQPHPHLQTSCLRMPCILSWKEHRAAEDYRASRFGFRKATQPAHPLRFSSSVNCGNPVRHENKAWQSIANQTAASSYDILNGKTHFPCSSVASPVTGFFWTSVIRGNRWSEFGCRGLLADPWSKYICAFQHSSIIYFMPRVATLPVLDSTPASCSYCLNTIIELKFSTGTRLFIIFFIKRILATGYWQELNRIYFASGQLYF